MTRYRLSISSVFIRPSDPKEIGPTLEAMHYIINFFQKKDSVATEISAHVVIDDRLTSFFAQKNNRREQRRKIDDFVYNIT